MVRVRVRLGLGLGLGSFPSSLFHFLGITVFC